MTELEGHIERITYTNEENGYTVARVSVEGRSEPVTVVGTLPDPSPGTTIKMQGEWTTHPKFGQQFKLESYQTVAPKSTAAIERYLAAGAVKGVGPATAKQIVDRFGTETLEVMDNHIERLRRIPGIGAKRLAQIRGSWEGQKAVREVMLFLQGNGVSPAYAARIFKRYGARSISIVRDNPFRLANEIAGIGFATADRIAQKLGYPPDGEERSVAGLLYSLDRCSLEGHLYLPAGELTRRAAELLEVDISRLESLLARLLAEKRVVADSPAPEHSLPPELPIYPPRLHAFEVSVAQRTRALIAPASAEPAAFRYLEEAATRLGEQQLEAIRSALSNGITVITGGPGTGKTTIIDLLTRCLSATGAGVALAAPTGRAAKRMSEATGREAKTIHRLLEVDPQSGGFRRKAEEPLDCDALIVDEISMVDIPLMAALLEALPQRARLVLVGDADQLPSVGPGNLLADLIASGVVPVSRLTEVYRQASGSRIISGAHAIIHGETPEFAETEDGDFYFIEAEDPERVVGLVKTLVCERIPGRFGFDPFTEIQVLTPMNRSVAGTQNLNLALQEALNPRGPSIERGERRYRVGDKVMQTRNNYDLDVFNGDIGRVVRVDSESSELDVDYEGTPVRYSSEDLDELSLAYAVTVHKSQGSEFPAVVLPLLTQHYMLLQRNLLYTAVTRGKRLVCIVGSRKALSMAIGNDREQERNSQLARRLRVE